MKLAIMVWEMQEGQNRASCHTVNTLVKHPQPRDPPHVGHPTLRSWTLPAAE